MIKLYEHQLESKTETKGTTKLWDFLIQTKKSAIQPDVKDYKRKKYIQIDMSVATDNNLVIKKYYRISK